MSDSPPSWRHMACTKIADIDPLLILPAGLPLVFVEWMPSWTVWVALVWIAALWAARSAARGRPTVATAVDLPVAALLLCAPAAVLAVSPDVAGLDVPLSRVYSLVFAIALAYALANWVRTPGRAWGLVGGLLAAGLALGAASFVMVQWTEKYAILTPILNRFPRWVESVPHPTLLDPKVHPNQVAALVLLFVPLALAVLVWPGGEREPHSALAAPTWVRTLALVALVALVPLLLLLQSRGAWLALAGALLLMAAIRRRVWFGAIGAMLIAGAVMVVAMGPAKFVSRLSGTGTAGDPAAISAAGRAELWQGGLRMIADHPFGGIGLNTFPLVYGQEQYAEWPGTYVYQGYAHAHNTLLQVALDFGLPGFAAVVGLYVALAWAAWRAHRRFDGTPLDAIAVGLVIGLAAHAAHGVFDAVAIGAKPGFVPWAFAGTLVGVRHYAHRWVDAPKSSRTSERAS